MFFKSTNTKGQGLMETIVAIGVVITGMVGAISLINFTLKSSTTSLNRLIALNLSWEAIEVAVNIRDSNYLAGLPFETDLDGGTDQSAILTFDAPSNVWFADFGPNSLTDDTTRLYRQGGLYTQSTTAPVGAPTQFRRLVIIDNSIADQLRLVSTVQWTERGNTKQVSNERVLYDWRAAAPPAPPPGPPPPAGCGDGAVVAPEFCDDGDFTDAGPCNATCSAFTYCGDGVVQNPNGGGDSETCDDGNTVSTDGCSASCQTE